MNQQAQVKQIKQQEVISAANWLHRMINANLGEYADLAFEAASRFGVNQAEMELVYQEQV